MMRHVGYLHFHPHHEPTGIFDKQALTEVEKTKYGWTEKKVYVKEDDECPN